MTVAHGRSDVRVNLDILKETLENMIDSTESRFSDIINSLKAQIFDIEHDRVLVPDEVKHFSSPIYDELDKYIMQRYQSRNKLVICIYSICEASLAEICDTYNYVVVKEPDPKAASPNGSKKNKCNKRKEKNTNYYLTDYLYSLNPNYRQASKANRIVSTVIRDLRNYLTHGKPERERASQIIEDLAVSGEIHLTQMDGLPIINKVDDLHLILNYCYEMLTNAEQIAQTK